MHLYLHVPFCARRCVYCDFAIAVRRTVPVAEFVQGVAQELAVRGLGGSVLHTVYLGGGTPSRLGGPGIAQLLGVVRDRFDIAPGAEVTVEANPEDVDEATALAWRAAGVTRLSLGVQSFDDRVLAWMHRTHRTADVTRAVAAARAAGITDLSLDLIFAMPEALPRDWQADLDAMLAVAPTHISVYGLTVEPGTPLGRWTARGEAVESPEERWAAECVAAHETLTAAGYEHYEVSNYAQPGHRARHNSAYWADRPFLGVGPSAHGFDGTRRRWNVAAYAEWLRTVQAGQDPLGGDEALTPSAREAERVYLGLRTTDGLAATPEEIAAAAPWIKAGWAERRPQVGSGPPDPASESGDRGPRHDSSEQLVLTMEGWLRLDALAASLTGVRSR